MKHIDLTKDWKQYYSHQLPLPPADSIYVKQLHNGILVICHAHNGGGITFVPDVTIEDVVTDQDYAEAF